MKSIKSKMLTISLSLLAVALIFTGGIACILTYTSTIKSLEYTMVEAVSLAADRVDAELSGYRHLAEELAGKNVFMQELYPDPATGKNNQLVKSEIISEFRAIEKRHGFSIVARTDSNGLSLETDLSVADRDYFKIPKETGKPYMSDLIIRKDNGEMNIFISAPITKNGVFDGILFFGIDANLLCNIVSNINIGETGNAAILDKNGNTLAYEDVQLVLDSYNTQEEAKKDKKLEKLAAIESEMVAGKTGVGKYFYGGKNKFMAYAPIPNTNGWSIDISIEQGEFLASTYKSIFITVLLTLAFLILSAIAMMKLSSTITTPITLCVDRIKLLAEGDLHSDVPTITTKDETGVLANSTQELVNVFSDIINDITNALERLSTGDLTASSSITYIGDFQPIEESITKIVDSLNASMSQIRQSSNIVAEGAEQMAQGSQSLSESSANQAASVEELVATFDEISLQINDTAENTSLANNKTMGASKDLSISQTKMDELLRAMEDIKEKSYKISSITKTITDIASQTNLLSLNASIEAARVGESGKGFAVVADQVRLLAAKSAEAVNDIEELIDTSIQSVNNGSQIADSASIALWKVLDASQSIADIVNDISIATQSQSESISQVKLGVEQLSATIQTNSATSEEAAATSEELTSQAQMLKDMVSQFKLEQ